MLTVLQILLWWKKMVLLNYLKEWKSRGHLYKEYIQLLLPVCYLACKQKHEEETLARATKIRKIGQIGNKSLLVVLLDL